MSSELVSSLITQLFSNLTKETSPNTIPATTHAIHAAFSLTNPLTWRWTLASDSALFALLTTKPEQEFLPPHRTISNGLFLGVFFFCLNSLYALLLSPYPRTTRSKQILAFPLLVTMLLEPLFFNCPLKLNHMGMGVTAIAVATRMVDLYYIQPWTGIPSRYCLETAPRPNPTDAVSRSKKDLDEKNATESSLRDADTFLMWDMERFKIEMWSPLRKFTGKKPSTTASPGLRWQDLIPLNIAYNIVLDIDIFIMSWYTSEQLNAMSLPQYAMCMVAVGSFIMVHILWIYVTVAMVYGMSTGRRIDTSEWTMLENKLPCFALTPVDFWNNWQTLFRYLWVDLAFLPVQRLCKHHLGPERVGNGLSKLARQTLPVIAVFALSGVLHAYVVYAVWREPIWSQLFYFLTQALGVILTKAMERTTLGVMIRNAYNNNGPIVRWFLTALGLSMMLFYHALTLPFFMEPYKKHNMWYELKQRSILWWIYGK